MAQIENKKTAFVKTSWISVLSQGNIVLRVDQQKFTTVNEKTVGVFSDRRSNYCNNVHAICNEIFAKKFTNIFSLRFQIGNTLLIYCAISKDYFMYYICVGGIEGTAYISICKLNFFNIIEKNPIR